MSLILEALKKLEREKGAPDRGFMILAHLPWAGTPRARGRWAAVVLLAGGAALAAAFFAWRAPSRPAERAPAAGPSAEAQATASAVPVPLPPAVAAAPTPRPRIELPAREPERAARPATATAPEPPPSATRLRLNAISQQDGRPVAVLNDRLVHEGDVFEGVRVLRIGAAEVEVEVEGVRRVIRF